MPDIAVSDQSKPVSGTTVSVVDGTLAPAPRPNTLISVSEPGERTGDCQCVDHADRSGDGGSDG
jgi:hypothetical protein